MLYAVGSAVKGFAVTLIIGLLANLFTAVFVCRLVFDILEKNRWITRVKMASIFPRPNVDFVGKRRIAAAASILVIVAGMAALISRGSGLLDIDFTGGTLAAVRFQQPTDPSAVRSLAAKTLPDATVEELQLRGEPAGHRFLIRTTLQDPERVKTKIRDGFGDRLARVGLAEQSMFDRLDNFGGQVAREMQSAAFAAIVISMFVIVGYLWIRFQNVRYGLGAVVALVHDVLVVLGLVAISGWLAGTVFGDALMLEAFKINLPMIAAFLTLVGYSVNDTIVVFDRIRETKGKGQPITWALINDSINQTLSRTILTGLATWAVALILYLLGGPAIHGFAFCLVAGVLVGTYSSIYIANPVLMWFGGTVGDPRLGGTAPASPKTSEKPVDRAKGTASGSRKNRKVA